MATSITSSTVSPFNSLLLQDTQYNVSVAFNAVTGSAVSPSVNFNSAAPWPTTANVIVKVYNSAITGSGNGVANGVYLQESSDNVTFTNVAIFNQPVLSPTDSSGAIAAASVNLILGPNAKQYLRVSAQTNSGSSQNLTGSAGLNVLF